ncbi:flavin reductase family protein [Actinomarinicola tropica]|uniref:Flavin reductase n=1 Tax=Actinomarinicola tropica TaxID=2789776 RepID=A0A5Q2RLM9_9ACTN|nr:flavin reductase family protein [Actinomarinicola tropica]QGG95336.1 flavin reductase [Actinomarinicola tropica]
MATPGGSGPIGPYPPRVPDTEEGHDEYDRLRRRVLWTLPYGLYVVGSRAEVDGEVRRNLMTLNWATQVSFEPKLVGIGVERPAWTHELISAGGVFSLCTIARDDRAVVRKFTKPAEDDPDAQTLNGFPYVEAVTGAPILASAPAYLDCEVRQSVELGNHTFFIGEVVDAAFLGDEEADVLRMEDTRMNYGG